MHNSLVNLLVEDIALVLLWLLGAGLIGFFIYRKDKRRG